MKRVRIQSFGRVQGVGFRFFVRQTALTLQITGYTKNLADGTVETIACGEPESIDTFISALKQGSRPSRVEQTIIKDYNGTEIFSEFQIRY